MIDRVNQAYLRMHQEKRKEALEEERNRGINQQEEEARNIKKKFEEESQACQVKYDKKAKAVEALRQKCVMIEKNLNDALKTVSTGSRDTIRKAAVNAALEAQNNCVETRIMLESELKKTV